MSEEGPHVTVVIPTRDRWELLRRALRSALAQRDVGVEAIVVDDASDTEPDEETRSIFERASVIRLDRHGVVRPKLCQEREPRLRFRRRRLKGEVERVVAEERRRMR